MSYLISLRAVTHRAPPPHQKKWVKQAQKVEQTYSRPIYPYLLTVSISYVRKMSMNSTALPFWLTDPSWLEAIGTIGATIVALSLALSSTLIKMFESKPSLKIEEVEYNEWHDFLKKENTIYNPKNEYYQTANNQYFKKDPISIVSSLVDKLLNERKISLFLYQTPSLYYK